MVDIPVDPPELSEYLESLNEPHKTYRVAANWLLDLDQYNEWMNEEDYEVDAAGKIILLVIQKMTRVTNVIRHFQARRKYTNSD